MSGEQAEERTAREGRAKRQETGVLQFPDDWPGIFIRGDNAIWWASIVRGIVLRKELAPPHYWPQLEGLAKLLESCNTRSGWPPVEATENSPAPQETTNSPTKPNEPALSEYSCLASRVEELENLIAKHSGRSRCIDSASGGTTTNDSPEIRPEKCIHDVPLLDECGWCKQAHE